jgi:hypothetical protein
MQLTIRYYSRMCMPAEGTVTVTPSSCCPRLARMPELQGRAKLASVSSGCADLGTRSETVVTVASAESMPLIPTRMQLVIASINTQIQESNEHAHTLLYCTTFLYFYNILKTVYIHIHAAAASEDELN